MNIDDAIDEAKAGRLPPPDMRAVMAYALRQGLVDARTVMRLNPQTDQEIEAAVKSIVFANGKRAKRRARNLKIKARDKDA